MLLPKGDEVTITIHFRAILLDQYRRVETG